MTARTCAALAVLVLSGVARSEEPAKITLSKGDKVVFLGDSITQAGVGPKGYVTILETALADKGVTVLGAGISGNKVPDLQRRLQRDVLAKKPTHVVIYIGINDVWHGLDNPARGTSKEKFAEGLEEIIGKIQKAGAKVIVCTPSVIGELPDGKNKADTRLDEYSDLSRKVAKKMKVPVCDLRKAFLTHLEANNKDGKAKGILTSDTVHLNDAGNKFVAETMLKSLGR